MLIAPLVAAGLALALPGASARCKPVPALDAALDDSRLRYLILGEVHGTNEGPRLVADIVCSTSSKRPTTVFIELPKRSQPSIDRYLKSNGDAAARRALLADGFWKRSESAQDGRSSAAMAEFIEALRAMKESGRQVDIVTFAPDAFPGGSQSYYELQMAAAWGAAPPPTGSLAVVLTGAFHARKAPRSDAPDIVPAARHLPEAEALSLRIVGDGGQAWYCSDAKCRAGPLSERDRSGRGVLMAASDGYDGAISIGGPFTASSPAAAPK